MMSVKQSLGYTLIEILIVLFIMSIVASVALLSIGRNSHRELASFTNDFTQLLTLAEEQAMLQPAVLGLALNNNSFQFVSYDALKKEKQIAWIPLQDTLLGKHQIPSDIQLTVEVNGHPVSFLPTAKNNPQIFISTNGDVTPFTIYVSKAGEKPRYVITGDADGNITNKLLS